MPVQYIKGDLFDSQECVAHCVNRDFGMAGGVAYEFKKRYGGVETLRSQHRRVGEAAMLVRDGRIIYYLITKKNLGDYPTYDAVEASLNYMYNHCKHNHVDRISIPKIGCGIDRLSWERVEEIVKRVFRDVMVTVYTL